MIKDVKSYIHTVGSRLSKAFSMEAFGLEEQLEFWEHSAEHFSRAEIPAFSDIVKWMDLLYRAPVHFVYKIKDEKLILDRRHVIPENILDKKGGEKDPHKENPQEKEYIRNFEHQLQNLEKKMDMDEVFREQGIATHAIGPCEHIPLFEKDGSFWGMYCVGPYTKSPAQITPKLSIVGRILASWLIGLDDQESNPQRDYREKIDAVVSDLGSGQLNTEGIAGVVLRYVIHERKASIGAVVECTETGTAEITSVGLDEEIKRALTGKEGDAICSPDGDGVRLTPKGKEWVKSLGVEMDLVPFHGEHHQGMLLLEKTDVSSNLNEENLEELSTTFAALLDYRQQNESFSELLAETYYSMLRSLEKSREKTQFHTPRMVAFVQRFGMMFGLEDDEMTILTKTAKLHDIGYAGALSVEPGKTIGGEIEHPLIGAELVKHLALDEDIIEGIKTHHEWVNGNGTPNGLKAEEIPWTGKIINLFEYVVDFVESHKGDTSKTDEEWIKLLSKGVMERADVEFDMVIVPTAIQLIQALGWEGCTQLGTQE